MSTLVKFSTLLMLTIAVLFLAATVSLSISAATPAAIDLCCDSGAPDHPAPVQEGECNDPGCRCLSCDTLFNDLNSSAIETVDDRVAPTWLLADRLQSTFLPSIDYPPEFL